MRAFHSLNEFIKEVQMHHHEYKDKVLVKESKESIATSANRLTYSDSVADGLWLPPSHEAVME